MHQHRDDFRVHPRRVGTDGLDADLVELAAAACGGAFSAEHRPKIEGPNLVALVDAVVGDGANDARRPFGTQGQAAVAAVLEGVHFLLDDVRGFAEVVHEDIGAFQDGGAQFGIAVAVENVTCGSFQDGPVECLWLPDV